MGRSEVVDRIPFIIDHKRMQRLHSYSAMLDDLIDFLIDNSTELQKGAMKL